PAFNAATTYRSASVAGTRIPLLGLQGGHVASIPCFASPRVDSSAHALSEQTDANNVRTISHNATGNEVSAFYGCWIDINQSSQPQFQPTPTPADGPWSRGRQTIQQLIQNVHQCLVAEIAFDPDPIPGHASPGASDKAAQRTL